jgi:hypothetical protein
MSAKKTAEAALAVSEEALRHVYSIQRSKPSLLVVVVFVLGYLYYINYFVAVDTTKVNFIIEFYKNTNLRMAIISIIILGMSGVFGIGFTHFSTIIGFAYVTSYITLKNLDESMENMENMENSNVGNKKENVNMKMDNNMDLHKKILEISKKISERSLASKMNPQDIQEEKMSDYSENPLSRSKQSCTTCEDGARSIFNPTPHEPMSPLMGIGNDNLPPMGVDFLSAPPGIFSQSQIAYDMRMA